MNKSKQIWFCFFALAVIVGSRVLYYFSAGEPVTDTYKYFAHAMVQAGERTPLLTSGLSFAYTESLSKFLSFAGNRIEAAGICQMVLQSLWLFLLFVGISLIAGRICGVAASAVLIFSPWVLGTLFEVSPENFYMLHWSLLLLLMSIYFYRLMTGSGCREEGQNDRQGWRGGERGRLYLLATGFYLGVVCIWNYLGWVLVIIAVYLLIRSRISCAGSPSAEEKEEADKEGQVKERPSMKTSARAFALLEGFLAGMFVTLMRYTALTGWPVVRQLRWWFSTFDVYFERCQDMQIEMPVHILAAILTGNVICLICHAIQKKKTVSGAAAEEAQIKSVEKTAVEKDEKPAEKEENFIIAEDGRKIRLLDNPLPGPKKHMKREMDFDITEIDAEKDDFDLQIRDNDEFDI